MSVTVCLYVLAISNGLSLADVKIPLDGSDWTFSRAGGSFEGSPAIVPGSIFTDLLRLGYIDDPYFRDNDVLYQWIGRSDWLYSKNFTVTDDILMYSNIDLECGGIDTISDIYVNDVLVGKTDNMFRRYIFPVKSALKVGLNTIVVKFASAVNYASGARTVYPYSVPPECPPPAQRGECHPNFIRKEQCSFSWDWGPSFPTMGIWRNITLQAYKSMTVRYVTARTEKEGSVWTVYGSVFLDIDGTQHDTATLDVSIANLTAMSLLVDRDRVEYKLVLPAGSVSEWMPNGHGNQTLYDLHISLTASQGDREEKRIQIGFRTVELIQEPIAGSDGLSFYFRINGQAIFMKGSNWIPADSFQERITTDYLRRLLLSAKHAHINMLRVWGGGVYESEEFYRLADEYGIMIWQDFMFACALYPTNSAFLTTVTEEITHQVRRLQHHPSIAIWAGNNENEGSIHKQDTQYYSDYLQLYIDTVRNIVLEEDSSRPFVSSSPSNGVQTMKEGWVAENPQSEYYGDVHHYDYFSDNWDWTIYPRPRFASEFGFQSWCSLQALKAVAIDTDFSWNSDFANHRNHHPDGNAQMRKEWEMHFDEPTRNASSTQQFEDFIYLTQINQAMGIRTEAELYRRLQGRIMDGRGHTMGALYWQLNDIWQAPTWASIEYGGKWKMLHYYVEKFFNQTILSAVVENNTLTVYYVDDHIATTTMEGGTKVKEREEKEKKEKEKEKEDHVLRFQPQQKFSLDKEQRVEQSAEQNLEQSAEQSVEQGLEQTTEQLTVYLYLFSFSKGNFPVKSWSKSFPKPTQPSTVIYQENRDALLTQSNCTVDTCFLVATTMVENIQTAPSSILFFSYFKSLPTKGLKAANVEIQMVTGLDNEGKMFALDLKSDAVAVFVWLDSGLVEGRFSENGFAMPWTHTRVIFYSWGEVSVDILRESLSVRSLMDMYVY